ncbi:MAG: family acetyltransferase [Spirosoma sp.]|nr:family acetyltransferase [Spirosoma sp.]
MPVEDDSFKTSMLTIQSITAEQTYPLRHAVLWPDKPFDYVKIDNDEEGYHYGAFRRGELVAVISLFIENDVTNAPEAERPVGRSGTANPGRARFRKFATRPDCQRMGIGTQLMQHIIAEARRMIVTTLWCDARLDVADFYRRFGMEPVSDVFYKGTISYAKFSLTL